MSVKACCDFCERPLPIVNYTEEEAQATGCMPGEFAETASTKELRTWSMFPMLCKNCATKLDRVIVEARETWRKEIDISSRNSLINSARRAATGSKG